MSRGIDIYTQELKRDLEYYQKIKQQCLNDIAKAVDMNDMKWLKARRQALKAINSAIARTKTIIENREKRSGYYQTKDGRPWKRFRNYYNSKCK